MFFLSTEILFAQQPKMETTSAEQRLKELGIKLPTPTEPFGSYVEAVQTGNLFFFSPDSFQQKVTPRNSPDVSVRNLK